VNLNTDRIAELTTHLQMVGIQIDPQYRAECARLADNKGTRLRYFRRSGLTIDGIGESLWEAGFTLARPTANEVLDLLETVLRPNAQRSKGRSVKTADAAMVAEDRARSTRNRKFECPRCHQIARGTRSSDLLCGRCYATDGDIVQLVRVDPLPEEILLSALAIDGNCERAA
jgi:hypothetical protein